MPPRALLVLPLLLPLLGPSAAGELSLFVGPPGGVGDVQVHEEASGALLSVPAELAGVRLLPLDVSGRTGLDELRGDRPRWRDDVPGASRVELPGGVGSLYRYRRDDPSGGPSAFGFFLVGASGRAQSLHEIPGAVDGTVDPWVGRIAVAPSGDGFLAATTTAAGGDLVEVELPSGVVHVRTAALPPLDVLANAMTLQPGLGAATTTAGVVRFARSAGATASFVPLTGDPAWFGDIVAASESGGIVAVVAGASPDLAHVHVLAVAGPSLRVSQTARPVSCGGALPASPNGPYLALSSDGSTCLWRTEDAVSAEAWLAHVELAPTPVQVTANARFVDTLDSTGEFGFFGAQTALAIVGEEEVTGSIDGGDVYRFDVDPATGAVTVTNLSMTSGIATAPFGPGRLKNEGGLWLVPGQGLLMHDDASSGQGDLVVLRPNVPGLGVLWPGVQAVEHQERAGGDFAVVVENSDDTRELLRVSSKLDGATSVVRVPASVHFQELRGRADGWTASVVSVPSPLPDGEWLARVHLPTGVAEILTETALPLGPAVGFTPAGSIASSVDLGPGRSLGLVWTFANTATVLPTGFRPAFHLP